MTEPEQRHGRNDVHVHIDRLTVELDLLHHVRFDDPLRVTVERTRRPNDPVTAVLTIGGSLLMPAQISIDDTTRTAQIFWVDDKGDTDAPEPPGAVVTYTIDDLAVASIDPVSGTITPLAEGTANVNASITDTSGAPLLEPDGVTPFTAPPAEFQVVAGQAVGAGLEIKA